MGRLKCNHDADDTDDEQDDAKDHQGAFRFGIASFDLESIEFGIKDRPQREEELRIKAMKQAALRAQTYAEALGVRLGRVLEINPETIEDEQSTGRYAFRRRSFVKVDNEARDPLVIPLEPEPVTLSADATVVWEIIK